MAHLEINRLTKSFHGNRVLDRIDIALEKGTFLSLLGPSGCGKTTTMRMVAGFESQDEGTISIGGQSIDSFPPYKRNIGMVFQSYALFPHMTVAQNVAYGLEQQRMSRGDIRKEVANALEMVQLTGYEQRKPKQLSGGQQQRVALARALVTKPSLLLLDESLSALDKNLRSAMQIELRMIQKEIGITTIFVTHDQEEAMTLSDRIAVMRAGRIEQIGSPHEIYEQPANTFVAGFVGQSNFLKGTLEEAGEGRARYVLDNGNSLFVPIPASGPAYAQGTGTILSIRPEKIRLTRDVSAQTGIKGTIKFITYVGSTFTYLVEALGQELKVQRQNDSNDHSFRQGEDVWLAWNAEHQTLLTE
ncbi:ABC transporter ATP-binding protein [Cohnella nanjingensis]|uniref:Spermidine/putrescine import ATP-binding protein PotA n=1 Tax=Cohnella nanjingensis TaxID=1387779 RepID=A0A7X0RY80_9BACL|nr:ABC transporter ATP-binding protein [Cohnella nanjingensis]MBB6674656.1 ABC transporter ATP-binding protein [Cohnella nanjingensis]